jgi:hypothetical protein
MRLKPLYRLTWTYPGEWGAGLGDGGSMEGRFFFLAEGRAEGAISGTMRAANHPNRRGDGTYLPDLHGVIETDDGAEILLDLGGYGRAYPAGRRQIVAWVTHACEDERYARLNDVVCAATGEVRAGEGTDPTVLVLDVAELVWEPIED